MSDEAEDIPIVEEEEVIEPEKPKTKFSETSSRKKNPNRVKQGLKLAAIGQKAKEEKMRKRVKDEMIKPTTWIGIGVVLSSVSLLGCWWLLEPTKENLKQPEDQKKEEPNRSRNYFN